MFAARNSRAYPEHDLPSPIKMGRKLCVLSPARPGATPRVILDAGRGAIGSPSVSFDGKWIYMAMAKDDGPFLHIYRLPADTAIAFQAVDAEGRSELNEMSWIYVRPGERRGCVGCHQSRQATPPHAATLPLALSTRPLRLVGQGNPHRFRGNNAAVTGLMELQFDRYREVAGINRHSQTVKPLATGADEVAALMAQLKSPDEGLRLSATQRLAIFREHRAAPDPAKLLGDANREVCMAAALALENLTGHVEPITVGEETSVAFRSAKGRGLRGAKTDNGCAQRWRCRD